MEFGIVSLILFILLWLWGRYDKMASLRRAEEHKQAAQEAFEAELAADRPEVLEAKAEAYEAEAETWKVKAEELETGAEAERVRKRAEEEALKKIPNPPPGSLAASVQNGERARALYRRISGIEFREPKPFPSLLEQRAAEARKLEREARKLAAEARKESELQRGLQKLSAKIREHHIEQIT